MIRDVLIQNRSDSSYRNKNNGYYQNQVAIYNEQTAIWSVAFWDNGQRFPQWTQIISGHLLWMLIISVIVLLKYKRTRLCYVQLKKGYDFDRLETFKNIYTEIHPHQWRIHIKSSILLYSHFHSLSLLFELNHWSFIYYY